MNIGLHGAGRSPHRARLGEILLADGAVDEGALLGALQAQSVSHVRIGEIIAARGVASRVRVAAAAAQQVDLGFVDLSVEPPDPSLIGDLDPLLCLRRRILPWRRIGDTVVYVSDDHRAGASALSELAPEGAGLALCEPQALRAALVQTAGRPIAERARTCRAPTFSMRVGSALWQRAGAVGAIGASMAAALVWPIETAIGAIYALAAVLACNILLWSIAAIASRPRPTTSVPEGVEPISAYRPLPRFTILVPLYREPETAPLLMSALRALDYPPELMDIKLILEADDTTTGPALMAEVPPCFVEIITAPAGEPRTKPRALNIAMEFAEGDIIGVYDAEDRPAPDQLRRIARAFADAPPSLACIQARLGYYNVNENLLTRLFEIEYAAWFDVMLPGLMGMNLPTPLGGTSFFIRRSALQAAGGWDSYNVTEDADLGVMLSRAGLDVGLCDSLTEEEANSRPLAWIKQRSRWLKGYLATWIVHMRRPVRLAAELGLRRFIGLNALLLSAVAGYLAFPLLWIAAGLMMALPPHIEMPPEIGQALDVLGAIAVLGVPAMGAASVLGLIRRGRRNLTPFLLFLPFYWALGAIAAYLAVFELATSPSSWRKTQHGVGRIARSLSEAARRGGVSVGDSAIK